jgi:hypothetical protein
MSASPSPGCRAEASANAEVAGYVRRELLFGGSPVPELCPLTSANVMPAHSYIATHSDVAAQVVQDDLFYYPIPLTNLTGLTMDIHYQTIAQGFLCVYV